MTVTEDRLAELRAQLMVAEAAVERAGSDGRKAAVRSAKAHHAAAEQALAEAHLEAQKASEPRLETRPESRAETRPAEAPAETRAEPEPEAPEPPAKVHHHPKRRALTLQELNQSASTQNVRGTHNLSPEQHSRRRNPERS